MTKEELQDVLAHYMNPFLKGRARGDLHDVAGCRELAGQVGKLDRELQRLMLEQCAATERAAHLALEISAYAESKLEGSTTAARFLDTKR